MNKRSVLALVAVACVAAGCTTTASGQPTAAPDGSSTGSSAPQTSDSSSSATPTVEIPPRPKDISLEGLDPCTLFTDEQRAELGASDVRSGESGSDHFEGMKECSLDVEDQEPYYGYTAMAVTFEGIEEWLTGNRNADAELTSVQGFPAVRFKLRDVDEVSCTVAVGVADKQYLMADVDPISDGSTQEKLCQMADRVAEMAMTTLQTLR